MSIGRVGLLSRTMVLGVLGMRCVADLQAWSGATEEGLTSRGGRNLRLPLRFGLRSQVPAELGQESQASRGFHTQLDEGPETP